MNNHSSTPKPALPESGQREVFAECVGVGASIFSGKAKPAPAPTTNGTVEQVAKFFKVSTRTVYQWISDRALSSWKMGRNVMIPEAAVVELWVKYFSPVHSLKPAELRDMGRAQWRSHLELCGNFRALDERLAEVERDLRSLRRRPLPQITDDVHEQAA